VVFLDALPKTANGKIKRFELRHRAAVDGILRQGGVKGSRTIGK
jgi:acyl-coenzyme A synthetase/AMP-(fatty) acid ligase